jgi:hypothetical protein
MIITQPLTPNLSFTHSLSFSFSFITYNQQASSRCSSGKGYIVSIIIIIIFIFIHSNIILTYFLPFFLLFLFLFLLSFVSGLPDCLHIYLTLQLIQQCDSEGDDDKVSNKILSLPIFIDDDERKTKEAKIKDGRTFLLSSFALFNFHVYLRILAVIIAIIYSSSSFFVLCYATHKLDELPSLFSCEKTRNAEKNSQEKPIIIIKIRSTKILAMVRFIFSPSLSSIYLHRLPSLPIKT